MGRLPEAPGQVVADGERHHTRRHEGRVAAARAAGAPGGVERVHGPAPDGIVGFVKVHRLRNVRLADHQAAGSLDPEDHVGILAVHVAATVLHAERRLQAADREALLHADGHTDERGVTDRAGSEPPIDRLRGGRRARRTGLNQRVETRGAGRPPLVLSHHFRRSTPPCPHGLGDRDHSGREHVGRGFAHGAGAANGSIVAAASATADRMSDAQSVSPSTIRPVTSTASPGPAAGSEREITATSRVQSPPSATVTVEHQ